MIEKLAELFGYTKGYTKPEVIDNNSLAQDTISDSLQPFQLPIQSSSLPFTRVFLTLLAVVFVGLVASIIPVSRPTQAPMHVQEVQEVVAQAPSPTPVPRLRPEAAIPELSAKAIYGQDVESGRVLFTRNATTPMLPASTTKIATAIVVLENYDLSQAVDVKFSGVSGKTMGLVQGEKISVRNLLYGLLVFSANDAAEVLAANHPLGRAGFVDQMNKVSKKAGLENTNFTNPAGFDQYLHFSTAKDLVKLSLYALKNPTFAEIVKTLEITVTSVDGRIKHKLANINRLLGSVPGVIGVKTGQTENSGESLVTLVERGGHRVLIAMLGSEDRFGETEKLIEWIFTSFVWETPLDS